MSEFFLKKFGPMGGVMVLVRFLLLCYLATVVVYFSFDGRDMAITSIKWLLGRGAWPIAWPPSRVYALIIIFICTLLVGICLYFSSRKQKGTKGNPKVLVNDIAWHTRY